MPRPPSNETPEQVAERKRGYGRKWRTKNREKSRQSGRDWRAANIEDTRRMSRDWIAQWRKDNPEKMKERNRRAQLKRFYGLTQEDVDKMLAKQDNRCAICRKHAPKQWHVDHCHKEGHVRGILCRLCNLGLGCFKDDPALLNKATRYITTNSPRKGENNGY